MTRYTGKYEANHVRRKRPWWFWALIVLLILTVLLSSAVIAVISRGRKMLNSAPPNLTQSEEYQSSENNPDQDLDEGSEDGVSTPEVLENYSVRHNGVLWQYNDSVVTFLLLGVDEETPDAAGALNGNGIQADVILLAIYNQRDKTLDFLTLSRDTMCEFSMLDEAGNFVTTGTGQSALSFSYGDGKSTSCNVTKEAVSQILFDLPIYSCSALYLDGLGILNDALGGVTFTPTESIPGSWPAITAGVETTFNASMAEQYIRHREMTESGNLQRMERQKQYCLALFQTAVDAVRQDPTTVIDIYQALQSSMVTDLTVTDVAYLATQILDVTFSNEIRSIPGETTLNEDNYVEFYIDESGLLEIILELYYDPIDE